jgi:hypothetical protein
MQKTAASLTVVEIQNRMVAVAHLSYGMTRCASSAKHQVDRQPASANDLWL